MNGFLGRLGDEALEALRFLTRLPLPGASAARGPADAVGGFTAAGLAIGGLLLLTNRLAALVDLPGGARDVVLVVALVLITGGLHLDGLMDSCDGLFGGHTVEQRLAIMRDSRVGSYAVMGACCVLLLKVGALGALQGHARSWALLLAPMLGRWSIVPAAALFPPARSAGLGAAFRAGLTTGPLCRAGLLCIVVCAAAGFPGLLTAGASCLGTCVLGLLIVAKIGGLTGDSYGAMVELNETLALLMLALLR